MKKQVLLSVFACILISAPALCQTIKRALFIGNSYTGVNNLPLLVSQVAAAEGDSLYYDSNTPGGYTLNLQSNDATTLAKIALGNWDYVALQAQSQEPSFSPTQVAGSVLPYAQLLDSLIHQSDSCAQTVFYMTWGRKNGDAGNCGAYPPVCTYSGMQSRLRSSYLLMAQQNNASVAPVGVAWREVRALNPPFDLYQSDESHPSIYGSYLAACVFYSSFFQKPVSSLTFTAGISIVDATLIQQKSNSIVFDSLQTWFGTGAIPFASFSLMQTADTVQFTNTSFNAANFKWYFGDGDSSSVTNPLHIYNTNGNYLVRLFAENSCNKSLTVDTINITTASIKNVEAGNNNLVYYDVNSGEIKIQNNANLQELSLEIFDASGKLVLKERAKPTLKPTLKSGNYLLKLSNKNKVNSGSLKFAVY